ncbi:patched domain-containing protein 3-like [Centruroides sculpturatus]|uniref:patched domain-containing protein 3-like n=1 Tax=Centruroides sculpturatus TaxID=218467 RepID=UPI000C6E74F4|nr:patched domain-containing protein 3-like [Centruroides sculpturatus]
MSTSEDYYDVIVADSGKIFNTKIFVESTFSYNSEEFSDQIRIPDVTNTLLIYITRKGGGKMFDKNVLSNVRLIDEIVQNVTLNKDDKQIHHYDICALSNNKCFQNPIIEVMSEVGVNSLLQKRKKLKYPIDIDPLSFTYKIYFVNLGGVILDNDNFIENFNAVMLYYSTDEKNREKKELFDEWMLVVYNIIQKYNFPHVNVFPNSQLFMQKEFMNKLNATKPKIVGLVAFMIVLSILFCMSNSWVQSKPFLGAASVMSAGLAVVSSFGLMSAFGIKNISWNATIPYLVLVTEIDDAFVLIGCWRVTNPKHTVDKRMEVTYCEAGISITLTSLTNFISYCIGMMSPFPFVRVFCYYTATCIVFTFLYEITFFGGCLAISGYREDRDIRSVVCFTGGESEEDREANDVVEETSMAFVRDVLGTILSIPTDLYCEKALVLDSHISLTTLILFTFEQHPHVAKEQYTVSWLKFYKEFQNNPVAKFSLGGYNMSNKQDFIDGLRNVFFKLHAAKSLSNDVVFNSDGTDILYSRFFVMGKNLNSSQTERDTLKEIWEIAEKSEIPVLVHCIKSSVINQVAIIVAISVLTSIIETLGYMSLWGVNVDIFSMMNLILCVGFSVNYPCHMSLAYFTSSKKSANEKMRDSMYRIGLSVIQGSVTTGLGILVLYSEVYFLSTFVKVVVLVAIETAFHALVFIPVVLSTIFIIFEQRQTV